MARKPVNLEIVSDAVAALDDPEGPSKPQQRDAVRALLSLLARRAPGKTVVPPYGAVQCVAGPRHTRGTPPNVVETDPVTFLKLAAGRVTFSDALAEGAISASGTRADLTDYLPLLERGALM